MIIKWYYTFNPEFIFFQPKCLNLYKPVSSRIASKEYNESWIFYSSEGVILEIIF